jgi:tetratricopeptide (TPR) repeat protein
MDNDTTSFWIDIKKYEDILAKDPGSYCFAPLAELYRKLGLHDDAIAIAERGNKLHPEFVSGCMALGRAYLDKGMKEQSQILLEKVVRSTPENLLAQKLLSQLYLESGEIHAAERALNVILSLNPDDLESKVLMESLSRSRQEEEESIRRASRFAQGAATVRQTETAEDESDLVIEDAELLEEISEEDFPGENVASSGDFDWADGEEEPPTPSHGKDPLTTGTLAELYASQGFIGKAMDIYRELLETDPHNGEVRQRLQQLEAATAAESAASVEMIAPSAPDVLPVTGTATLSAPGQGGALPEEGGDVVTILEGWLANIRRRG